MEAIIQTGSKQYQVSKGQQIKVEKLDAKAGDTVDFDVLALYGDKVVFGTPLVEGAKVVGKVLEQTKGDKIVVSTYKRRKGLHKKQGHRQELTKVEIQEVLG